MVQAIFFILIGFVLLIKGADWLVSGASNVAKKFHIPEIVIGLTIVSMGTSMPELFVSTTSAINGHPDMAMGNVVGSNACNLLLILGLASSIRRIKFQRETRLIEIPMCLFFTIVFMIFCNTQNQISRIEGIVLLALFVCFIGYTIFMAIKGEKFDEEDNEDDVAEEINKNEMDNPSIFKNIFLVIIGVLALKFGGDFTVDNSVYVAEYFKLSEKIISLTILAIGTSLPELVTSVMAAIKGNSDIAIGNIIGSNIFNMLFIIGTTALIHPIAYSVKYNIDMTVVIVSIIILALFPLIPPKNMMSKRNGAAYLVFYGLYLILMFNV